MTGRGWSLILLCALFVSQIDCQCNVNGVDQFCEPVSVDQAFEVVPLATSTCGSPIGTFCYTPIGGTRSCGIPCDATVNRHPPEHMTDFLGSNTWWQSANNAQPTADFLVDVSLALPGNKTYEISYVSVEFRQQRPESMVIFKSLNYGESYDTAFQFYSYSCMQTYSIDPVATITSDKQLTCKDPSTFTDVVSDNVITFRPTDGRPGLSAGVVTSEDLLDFITATGIRLRLQRIQTNSNSTEDLYYGISNLNVLARCKCNGHAETCSENSSGTVNCDCAHNTEGQDCELCKPLFNNKPWNRGLSCEMCMCNSHSSRCEFNQTLYESNGDKDGGVCMNCQHNTAGIHCEQCAEFYYPNTSLSLDNPNICIACNCETAGVVSGNMDCARLSSSAVNIGDCTCKPNVTGQHCNICKPEFWDLDITDPNGCKPCGCNTAGTVGGSALCNVITGMCNCKTNVEGQTCGVCKDEYYGLNGDNLSGCFPCNCNLGGSVSNLCNKVTGQCTCRSGLTGRDCSLAQPGTFLPPLDYNRYEAELTKGSSVHSLVDGVGTMFTHTGFTAAQSNDTVVFSQVTVPDSGLYQVVIRYTYSGNFSWSSAALRVTPDLSVGNGRSPVCHELNSSLMIDLLNLATGNGVAVVVPVPLCLRDLQNYNFELTLGSSGSGRDSIILIDSLVVIPIVSDFAVFKSDLSLLATYMNANCVQARYTVQGGLNENNTCRSISMSIAAEVYSGSLNCSCNSDGSVNGMSCNNYTGQCDCHSGVFGRTCDVCLPGYHSFSSSGCTECNCSSSSFSPICNSSTGECSCLPNVVDLQCSQCAPNHFGFMTSTGCQPCSCDAIGSRSPQCSDIGQCPCKNGVTGRACRECLQTHYNFTSEGCMDCQCNMAGSTAVNCTNNGVCYCKSNVHGHQCDLCNSGFYNLDDGNYEGCQPCFGFGWSLGCTSALGYTKSVVTSDFGTGDRNRGGWKVVQNTTGIDYTTIVSLLAAGGLRVQSGIAPNLYLEAPGRYLGNQLASYAQTLVITLRLVSDLPGERPDGPDVILSSSDGRTVTLRLNPTPSFSFETYTIQLDTSAGWQTEVAGVSHLATTYDIQRVLVNLNHLLIRAIYDMTVPSVFIDISLEIATSSLLSDVTWVENSTCPVRFTGLLCESCAPGYTRAIPNDDPYTDCVVCNCSGHSTSCDAQSGVCSSCGGNTTGDHCELCSEGFYESLSGDCLPCPCPLTSGPGQFTKSCELQHGHVVCVDCPSGHYGDDCGQCLSGYFGNPLLGTTCSNCSCSGNIDTNDPDSCNMTTGECLKCLYHTAGPLCNLCENGYYGSAFAKNCTECGCQLGAADVVCSEPDGQCICLYGAAGFKCDSCLAGFYGLSSSGCKECNCSAQGSTHFQCNSSSGVCSCKPGVGGDKCNECLPGFYNLRTTGCIACDCHPYGSLSQNAQCELTTGQCPCKPGAIGRHCDSCSSGFFNVTQGCPTCQCNGHSSQCDVVSGVCSGCDDNTEGSNCQSCLNGFFGDATRGTATDCQPCPCPGIALSSRFSNTCKLKQDGTAKCTNCSEGHDGDNCEFCSDGYFGDPMGILGTPSPCVKCDCSGNVNETAKNNCNNLTGICSQCLYNTAGDHCEFCADGYYGSALAKNCTACGCDPVGAAGITCLEPDGHCICRLNVMGQICDSCLASYYNLTSDGCQECLCNPTGSQSLSCDQASGNCQCKPGVWGGKCDQCQPGFYGLSSEGCTACGCVPSGSTSIECNQTTGQCQCKEAVTGTQCDTCLDGFFSIAAGCQECNCNNHSSMCSNKTGECYNCQDNTEGSHCEVCIEGFYGRPTTGTPDDCRQCPCPLTSPDGFSDTCQLDGVGVVCTNCTMGHTGRRCEACLIGFYGDPSGQMGAPSKCQHCDCNGNVDTDIAGNCNTTTGICSNCYNNTGGDHCEHCADDYYGDAVGAKNCTACNCDPDGSVPGLSCNNTTGQCPCQPFVLGELCDVCATNYWNKTSGLGCEPCNCDSLGSTGQSCDAVSGQCNCKQGVDGRRCDQCLPGYFDFSSSGCQACSCYAPGSVGLSCNQITGQCQCREGAEGLQCDACKNFYFNVTAGCLVCDCYGHAVQCDSNTGFCLHCQHNTKGDYCNQCIDGYYGNATQGTADDCKPCQCPGNNPITTFSRTCELLRDGQVQCTACQDGHTGLSCEICAPSFFGDPVKGLGCSDCTCNGNIDPSDPTSCNRTTGVCIACLYNTTGRKCETCADGYFGNATTQSCTSCQCDPRGTVSIQGCNPVSGFCFCLPNVYGDLCDQCVNEFYDFGNPSGCQPCNCNSVGSLSSQCDNNGQCSCKPNVAGKQCDHCDYGSYNLQLSGCIPCNCNSDGSLSLQCDDLGQCPCDFGVTGQHCDMCAENFVGNGTHCDPCGVCYEDVQAGVQQLRLRLQLIQRQVAAFKETRENKTFAIRLADNEARIDDLKANLSNATVTADSLWIEIRDVEKKIEALETQLSEVSVLSSQVRLLAVTADAQSKQVEEEVTDVEIDATEAYHTLKTSVESRSQAVEHSLSNITASANTSTNLANEASVIADLHQTYADQVNATATDASNIAWEAKTTATRSWLSQQTDKQRLPEVTMTLAKYTTDAEKARLSVVAVEAAAAEAKVNANGVLTNVSSPPPDHSVMVLRQTLNNTKETTASLAAQTDALQRKYSDTVAEVNQKRVEATNVIDQANSLGSQAESLYQRASEALKKASTAVNSGSTTVKEAEDMLDILQNFNTRITDTSSQANVALQRVDEIWVISERTSEEAREILSDHQQALADSQQAMRVAQQAQLTAEEAEQTANNVKDNFDRILITASTQKSEAADTFSDAVLLNMSANSLQSDCAADSRTVEEKSNSLDTALSNLGACDQRIDGGKVKVEQLLADIEQLDRLDVEQVKSLSSRLDQLKEQLSGLDLTATLASLVSQLDQQKKTETDHQNDIMTLRGELEEVKLLFQKTCT